MLAEVSDVSIGMSQYLQRVTGGYRAKVREGIKISVTKEPLPRSYIVGGKLFGEKVWVDFFVEIVEEDEENEKAIVDQALVEVE